MNRNQKLLWSDKLMDLANLALAGLVFGSLLSGKSASEIRLDLLISGVVLYILCTGTAHFLRR